MTKLYNKTHLDDATLDRILTLAGRSVGARTSGVVVKVTEGRSYWQARGTATLAGWVYLWWLSTRARTKSGDIRQGTVDTDGGMIHLIIPYTLDNLSDPIDRAEAIYSVAAHEFAHVAEFQVAGHIVRYQADQRKRHDNRPWEKTAIRAANKALQRVDKDETRQDAILALALEIETLGKRQRS